MGFGRGRFSLNRMLMKLDLGPLAGGTFPKFCPQSCVCKFVLIFLKRAPQVVQAPGPTQAEELPLAAPPLPGPAPLRGAASVAAAARVVAAVRAAARRVEPVLGAEVSVGGWPGAPLLR